MELFYVPNLRERFLRRNFPRDDFMQSHYGYPYSFYDEDFPLSDYPFPLTKRHVSFILPKGRYFQKKEDKKEEKESKGKVGERSKKEAKSDEASSNENKERSLLSRDDFLRNLINLEEVFPSLNEISSLLRSSDEGPFEVNVNLHGCDPDKVKVEIKDSVLKIEGRKETSNGSFTFIKHEQSIPKDIDPSKIKASLLPEGVLKVRQVEQTHNIPITMETGDQRKQAQKKDDIEIKT